MKILLVAAALSVTAMLSAQTPAAPVATQTNSTVSAPAQVIPISYGVFYDTVAHNTIFAGLAPVWSLPFKNYAGLSLNQQGFLGGSVGPGSSITGGTEFDLRYAIPKTDLSLAIGGGPALFAGSKPHLVLDFSVKGSFDLGKIFKF